MSNISTPIFDFVQTYAQKDNVRFHMPGHKGKGILGIEKYDITEIYGADSLFEADGIICESEKNLAEIFGTRASFYSTEGSSLCIRAMLQTVLSFGRTCGKNKIVAARNVHKAFVYSAALLDFDISWLGCGNENLYCCNIDLNELEQSLVSNHDVAAVYVTSPDYLGNIADIKAISKVCKKCDVPLIVDNAHGAYLKFVMPSMHPVDLGADMCCDSAHKTLPVLTGGAYLHVSKDSKYDFEKHIKNSMALFASTSPSYIILASLDMANKTLCGNFQQMVNRTAELVENVRIRLKNAGYHVVGNEPLKITLKTKIKGYYGTEIAQVLEKNGIWCECSDKDNVVLMFSPYNTQDDIEKLCSVLCGIDSQQGIDEAPPVIDVAKSAMSVRCAIMSRSEKVQVSNAVGRILASPSVSCPPAIPVAICGERITEQTANCFLYYGINEVDVVME